MQNIEYPHEKSFIAEGHRGARWKATNCINNNEIKSEIPE
jgi:hypothetical protein